MKLGAPNPLLKLLYQIASFITWLFSNLVARARMPKWALKTLCKLLNIDLSEAEKKDVSHYSTFLEIFLRTPSTISIDPSPLVAPCQGLVECLFNTNFFQAEISLKGFLNLPNFEGVKSGLGIYLSPSDFHVVYSPLNCRVKDIFRVNGKLTTVNRRSILFEPQNWFLNERLVVDLEGNLGNFRLIFVGALGVSGLKAEEALTTGASIKQGQRIFSFELGSFIWLVSSSDLNFCVKLGHKLRIGQALI